VPSGSWTPLEVVVDNDADADPLDAALPGVDRREGGDRHRVADHTG
jgi:hypothetical protein